MRLSRLSTVLGGALAVALLGVAPVHAEPDLVGATIYAAGGGGCSNRTYSDCDMLNLKVELWKDQTPPGTTVLLQLRGCEGDEDVRMTLPDAEFIPKVGRPYTVSDTFTTEDGTRYEVPFGLWTSYPGETFHLGPRWTGTLTVTRPGLEPWVQQISHASPSGDATLGRFTDKLVCPRDDPDPSTLVDTWSKLTGKPIVGRRVSITRTTFVPAGLAVGARATYAWLVNDKVVGRRLSLKVKRSWRGKMLRIRVTISAPGKKDDVETGTVGRVRVRR